MYAGQAIFAGNGKGRRSHNHATSAGSVEWATGGDQRTGSPSAATCRTPTEEFANSNNNSSSPRGEPVSPIKLQRTRLSASATLTVRRRRRRHRRHHHRRRRRRYRRRLWCRLLNVQGPPC